MCNMGPAGSHTISGKNLLKLVTWDWRAVFKIEYINIILLEFVKN